MSVAAIEAQIREVQEKIAKCQEALNVIGNAKGKALGRKDDLSSSYQPLGGNGELKAVQTKEVFEGEMANALGPKVGNCCGKIESGIQKADTLISALSRQESLLNQKVSELQGELSILQRRLAEAIEEEQRRLAILSSSAYRK